MSRFPSLAVVSSLPSDAPARRDPGDDFYCLRFKVWYPSIDCAFRTLHRTCPGCFECEQGRFNLKRHHAALARDRSIILRCD